MSYLKKGTTSTLINIKLTEKGRELLAKGFKDDNVFDIAKFSLGDSEVDYSLINGGDDSLLTSQLILSPSNVADDPAFKLYASGVVPNGTPYVTLSTSVLNMTRYQSDVSISVNTSWSPVSRFYIEEYRWINLGPLNDYDFSISKSLDTRVGTIRTYDTVGTTVIKIQGMISGAYALLTLNIE